MKNPFLVRCFTHWA